MVKSIHKVQYRIFLNVLRQARKRAGVTQVELAQRLGTTQTFISKCERGERRLDVIDLRTFCAAIGIPLKQFIGLLERKLPRG